MNMIPNEHEELVRLLPESVELELPTDRRRDIQEFVMNHIQHDARPAATRSRRPLFLGLAMGGVAVVAAGAVAVVTIGATPATPPTQTHAQKPAVTAAAMTGSQVLLAAASSAEKATVSSGKYWYIKTSEHDAKGTTLPTAEQWTAADGQLWFRNLKTKNKVEKIGVSPLYIGGHKTTFTELANLPSTPAALKSWLTKTILADTTINTSMGRPSTNPKVRELFVFNGLVGLVSTLPASPKVRAAALRAIAAYPNVRNAGTVNGGQALRIRTEANELKLVVDSKTGRVRETNFLVNADGSEQSREDGAINITAEWTDSLPK